jgi:hypothetical protein
MDAEVTGLAQMFSMMFLFFDSKTQAARRFSKKKDERKKKAYFGLRISEIRDLTVKTNRLDRKEAKIIWRLGKFKKK